MRVRIVIGGFPGETTVLESAADGRLRYRRGPGRYIPEDDFEVIDPDVETWERFRRFVRDECAGWASTYHDLTILDGTEWEVEIEDGDLKIRSHGSNAFSDNWDAFVKAAERLAGGRRID